MGEDTGRNTPREGVQPCYSGLQVPCDKHKVRAPLIPRLARPSKDTNPALGTQARVDTSALPRRERPFNMQIE